MIVSILDTNVLVSAACLPGSLPADLLRRWLDQQFALVVSESILDELTDVLRRPKIVNRYAMTEEKVQAFLGVLREFAAVLTDTAAINAVPDDPDDNHVVACAVAGGADVIVSGDRHLKVLGQYAGIRILSPVEFRALLEEARGLRESEG